MYDLIRGRALFGPTAFRIPQKYRKISGTRMLIGRIADLSEMDGQIKISAVPQTRESGGSRVRHSTLHDLNQQPLRSNDAPLPQPEGQSERIPNTDSRAVGTCSEY